MKNIIATHKSLSVVRENPTYPIAKTIHYHVMQGNKALRTFIQGEQDKVFSGAIKAHAYMHTFNA